MKPESYVVHIVDDEEPARKSLAFLLSVSGFTVRVHESATSFLAAAPTLADACLVTDLRMPDMSAVELLEELGAIGALPPTIIITGHGDVPMAVSAMKAGAVDFIEKPFEDRTLIDAITRAASRLEGTVEVSADDKLLRARLDSLSDRERQVLSAVVSGLPNKTIAYDLDISRRTVEVHRANIMSKMQAKSLAELVRMAIILKVANARQSLTEKELSEISRL